MYVSREELTENLRRLDTASLREKLRIGGLTKDAKELILEELARRGSIGDDSNEVEPVNEVTGRTGLPFGRRNPFDAWQTLCQNCLRSIHRLRRTLRSHCHRRSALADALTGHMGGYAGGIATFGAGLPWTYLLASAAVYSASPMKFVALSWSCVALNFALFTLYFRRTR